MTASGEDFLENWVQQNVNAADHIGGHSRATILALRCVRDAAARGIALEEKAQGLLSITATILDAMVRLAEPGTPGD